MNPLVRRIGIWAASGAAVGIAHALASGLTIRLTLISIFIGSVSGATAGAVASIPVQKFIQTVITGAAGGLCAGVKSYWLFGSSRSFGEHTANILIGLIPGILIFRYLRPSFNERTHQYSTLWAEQKNVSKA